MTPVTRKLDLCELLPDPRGKNHENTQAALNQHSNLFAWFWHPLIIPIQNNFGDMGSEENESKIKNENKRGREEWEEDVERERVREGKVDSAMVG